MQVLFGLSCLAGLLGVCNVFGKRPLLEKQTFLILLAVNVVFIVGFLGICRLHYSIYQHLPLVLSGDLAAWLNTQLSAMNDKASYGMPLYDPAHPPRYMIPVWIENEKYYFWFMCYSILALSVWKRPVGHRLRGMLLVFLTLQVTILYFAADPFHSPLPRFFTEIAPWFAGQMEPMNRLGLFMKLYPRMIFYYNASYMWLHPPMLFLSYACVTVTFIASVFMLVKRDPAIEKMGYDCAKLGYFLLTLGMLLGYPWALQAWGPNWWWDPKICASIMMWAIYSTYLHTRLYANKPSMWYFTSALGIVCFLAMIFTFITTFYFPGEHTFQ
jgi:hypothetical protein